MAQENKEMVFEIAIIGRVTWNLHSLNNEGSVGTVTEPRTVVLWDGTKTDGVSGEMMKHIHAFWTWVQAKQDNLPLCDACQRFQPQRADAARGLKQKLPKQNKQNQNAEAMRIVIEECTLCDIHGFLIQQPTINRKSTVEFGWVIGLPGKTQRDLHIHARHALGERGDKAEQAAAGQQQTQQQDREVSAQMIYHRPTRSGVYGFVTLFQPWRIGLNEVDYTYALDDDARKRRYKLAITAYEWTFKRPDGAMTTTRLPHIEDVEGYILVAREVVPVPIISPLRENYKELLKELAEKQNVEAMDFIGFKQFIEHLGKLKEKAPLRLGASEQKEVAH